MCVSVCVCVCVWERDILFDRRNLVRIFAYVGEMHWYGSSVWWREWNKNPKNVCELQIAQHSSRGREKGGGCWRGQTRLGWGCRRGQVTGAVGGWNSVHITMQTPRLTMEAPSVPVSYYKSGVTQSAEDNRPPHLIKWHRLLLRVKAPIDFTLTHSLVREQRAAKAGSRLPRIIHSPSHKVPFVYSGLK